MGIESSPIRRARGYASVAARSLAVLFLASLLAPLSEALLPELELARGSYAALALAPWLVFALLPSAAGAPRERVLDTLAWRGGLCLPPLCLGAGLDLARGADPRALLGLCALGWLVFLLWCAASLRSAGSARCRMAFAWLWFLLLPGIAGVRTALAWVARRGDSGAEEGGVLFALDPWVWWHRWARADGLGRVSSAEGVAVLAGALLANALVLGLERRDRASELA